MMFLLLRWSQATLLTSILSIVEPFQSFSAWCNGYLILGTAVGVLACSLATVYIRTTRELLGHRLLPVPGTVKSWLRRCQAWAACRSAWAQLLLAGVSLAVVTFTFKVSGRSTSMDVGRVKKQYGYTDSNLQDSHVCPVWLPPGAVSLAMVLVALIVGYVLGSRRRQQQQAGEAQLFAPANSTLASRLHAALEILRDMLPGHVVDGLLDDTQQSQQQQLASDGQLTHGTSAYFRRSSPDSLAWGGDAPRLGTASLGSSHAAPSEATPCWMDAGAGAYYFPQTVERSASQQRLASSTGSMGFANPYASARHLPYSSRTTSITSYGLNPVNSFPEEHTPSMSRQPSSSTLGFHHSRHSYNCQLEMNRAIKDTEENAWLSGGAPAASDSRTQCDSSTYASAAASEATVNAPPATAASTAAAATRLCPPSFLCGRNSNSMPHYVSDSDTGGPSCSFSGVTSGGVHSSSGLSSNMAAYESREDSSTLLLKTPAAALPPCASSPTPSLEPSTGASLLLPPATARGQVTNAPTLLAQSISVPSAPTACAVLPAAAFTTSAAAAVEASDVERLDPQGTEASGRQKGGETCDTEEVADGSWRLVLYKAEQPPRSGSQLVQASPPWPPFLLGTNMELETQHAVGAPDWVETAAVAGRDAAAAATAVAEVAAQGGAAVAVSVLAATRPEALAAEAQACSSSSKVGVIAAEEQRPGSEQAALTSPFPHAPEAAWPVNATHNIQPACSQGSRNASSLSGPSSPAAQWGEWRPVRASVAAAAAAAATALAAAAAAGGGGGGSETGVHLAGGSPATSRRTSGSGSVSDRFGFIGGDLTSGIASRTASWTATSGGGMSINGGASSAGGGISLSGGGSSAGGGNGSMPTFSGMLALAPAAVAVAAMVGAQPLSIRSRGVSGGAERSCHSVGSLQEEQCGTTRGAGGSAGSSSGRSGVSMATLPVRENAGAAAATATVALKSPFSTPAWGPVCTATSAGPVCTAASAGSFTNVSSSTQPASSCFAGMAACPPADNDKGVGAGDAGGGGVVDPSASSPTAQSPSRPRPIPAATGATSPMRRVKTEACFGAFPGLDGGGRPASDSVVVKSVGVLAGTAAAIGADAGSGSARSAIPRSFRRSSMSFVRVGHGAATALLRAASAAAGGLLYGSSPLAAVTSAPVSAPVPVAQQLAAPQERVHLPSREERWAFDRPSLSLRSNGQTGGGDSTEAVGDHNRSFGNLHAAVMSSEAAACNSTASASPFLFRGQTSSSPPPSPPPSPMVTCAAAPAATSPAPPSLMSLLPALARRSFSWCHLHALDGMSEAAGPGESLTVTAAAAALQTRAPPQHKLIGSVAAESAEAALLKSGGGGGGCSRSGSGALTPPSSASLFAHEAAQLPLQHGTAASLPRPIAAVRQGLVMAARQHGSGSMRLGDEGEVAAAALARGSAPESALMMVPASLSYRPRRIHRASTGIQYGTSHLHHHHHHQHYGPGSEGPAAAAAATASSGPVAPGTASGFSCSPVLGGGWSAWGGSFTTSSSNRNSFNGAGAGSGHLGSIGPNLSRAGSSSFNGGASGMGVGGSGGGSAGSLLSRDLPYAEWHPCVSVLFADIVGFTQISNRLPAVAVMEMLNALYCRLDALCANWGQQPAGGGTGLGCGLGAGQAGTGTGAGEAVFRASNGDGTAATGVGAPTIAAAADLPGVGAAAGAAVRPPAQVSAASSFSCSNPSFSSSSCAHPPKPPQVYKVQIIGDAYMVATGLLREDPGHAATACRFALAALREAAQVLDPCTGRPLRLRVGIHSGPVVSGLVGRMRRQYSVFGDTVNVASRMESSGAPGCIHVSDATQRLAAPLLAADPGLRWLRREGVQIKGKGRMDTYWLMDASGGGMGGGMGELAMQMPGWAEEAAAAAGSVVPRGVVMAPGHPGMYMAEEVAAAAAVVAGGVLRGGLQEEEEQRQEMQLAQLYRQSPPLLLQGPPPPPPASTAAAAGAQ